MRRKAPTPLERPGAWRAQTLGQEARGGMGNADGPRRRQLFELPRLRLTTGDDPDGTPLGRKHRYGIR